ncbi:hypothetical protein [Mycobacterium sp. 1465703.0]|uniref:hypothetical protein n=1 Tax=Mycobacterium sp. 1465703.0 TaxID=1834078 RepID=UPI0007FEACB6|nr:hypothetical protein [Mycobacterium sp. 1465703.0]OBJ10559.1 hypothetical protein A5625_10975 [Mycobacterium sp. 1465703.0]
MTDERPETLFLRSENDGAALRTGGEDSGFYMRPPLSANPAVLVADAGRAFGFLLANVWAAGYRAFAGVALSNLGSGLAYAAVSRRSADHRDIRNPNGFQ